MAHPHDKEGQVGDLRRRTEAQSASSLYSTSEDLARFMLEIMEPSDRGAPQSEEW